MNTRLLNAPTKIVRPLLPRTWWYMVPTTTLMGFLAHRIVVEQHEHRVADIVRWAMAMHDVAPAAGGTATATSEQIGEAVERHLRSSIGTQPAQLQDAIIAVRESLATVFGQQLRVTGWLPGHHVAEGRTVLGLTGQACPSCTENPVTYVVGDRSGDTRCLNSEDCGWTSR